MYTNDLFSYYRILQTEQKMNRKSENLRLSYCLTMNRCLNQSTHLGLGGIVGFLAAMLLLLMII